MTKKQKNSPSKSVVVYHLDIKFTPFAFCPLNAIDPSFYRRDVENVIPHFMTRDGVECSPEFLSCWNNEDSRYDAQFEELCQEYYGLPFRSIRSVWISRLGSADNYWHLIKLVKI